jgi:hypothetical protein
MSMRAPDELNTSTSGNGCAASASKTLASARASAMPIAPRFSPWSISTMTAG